MAPILRQVYDKWQSLNGLLRWACASQEVYLIHLRYELMCIPVDVYVPDVSQTRANVDGVMKLQELVRTESVRRRSSPEYQELLAL
jgi:NADH-quinone oxidoreductase subunit B